MGSRSGSRFCTGSSERFGADFRTELEAAVLPPRIHTGPGDPQPLVCPVLDMITPLERGQQVLLLGVDTDG